MTKQAKTGLTTEHGHALHCLPEQQTKTADFLAKKNGAVVQDSLHFHADSDSDSDSDSVLYVILLLDLHDKSHTADAV